MTEQEMFDRLLERLMPPYDAQDLADLLRRVGDRYEDIRSSGHSVPDALADVLDDIDK